MAQILNPIHPYFSAKLLLFGEYSIVVGGQGLALPLPVFKGILTTARTNVLQHNKEIAQSNDCLRGFCSYLIQLQQEQTLLCPFDLALMQTHVRQGLYFDSDIPHGYGLGSSGALSAAIYDAYAEQPIQPGYQMPAQDIAQLRMIFAQMEAFFHGASSGIDPLVSYINLPLQIHSATNMQPVHLSDVELQDVHFFLFDTQQQRPAHSGLVPLFVKKMEEPLFNQLCRERLADFNNQCIDALLNNGETRLWENMGLLSEFQLKYFTEMIPPTIVPVWQKGLETKEYSLKLCGAGGGGFMLGLCPDIENAKEMLGSEYVIEIFVGKS